jgi:hypothetical protein
MRVHQTSDDLKIAGIRKYTEEMLITFIPPLAE